MLKWLKTNFDKYVGGDATSYDHVRLSADIEEQIQQHQRQQLHLDHGAELFDDNTEKTPFLVLAYLFFIVIASVLGMGILGLPVKLSQSGFTPFIGSYTLCYFMQILSLFFVIEILQRCYAIIRGENPSIIGLNSSKIIDISNSIGISSPTNVSDNALSSEEPDFDVQKQTTLGTQADHPTLEEVDSQGVILSNYEIDTHNSQGFEKIDLDHSQTIQSPTKVAQVTPNLHYLGLKFLGPTSHKVFIFSVVLHFTAILISYGLAAAMAYSKLFVSEDDQSYFILPMIVLFTLVVVFGSKSLQHIITFFTFGKGTLLIAIVLITGVVANHVQLDISNDWTYVGRSFLISTVALGGASGVIPVVFSKIVFSRREMYKCYATVFSALTTVFLLNICWCWFLLRIIPQMPDPSNPQAPNLFDAGKNSQIATIPLMKVIHDYYPQYLWIAWAVDIFIVISITISYITVGSGYKQTLDGFSVSWRSKSLQNKNQENNGEDIQDYDSSSKLSKITKKTTYAIKKNVNWVNNKINEKEVQSVDSESGSTNVKYPIREYILYLLAFGFILTVALCNPKGFLLMLESGASLGLNLQAGLFAVLMLNFSRKAYSHFPIPLPIHKYIFNLRYVVLIYFTSAVLYDIFELIK